MEEFVKGECPHCGQSIEFPAEGTGQTVPCPTCGEPFVLKPAAPPAPPAPVPAPVAPAPTMPPKPTPSATISPAAPTPAVAPKPAASSPRPLTSPAVLPEKEASRPVLSPTMSAQKKSSSAPSAPHPETARFEQACRGLENEPAFAKHPPTREQIGRAWAWVKFQKADTSEWPSHADLVAAMKTLFAEYKDPKPPRVETKKP